VASLTSSFDAELAGLRRRGLALALDLKLWEGQQLRQYQQLQLLKVKLGAVPGYRGQAEGAQECPQPIALYCVWFVP
jgi:hypothetical protein